MLFLEPNLPRVGSTWLPRHLVSSTRVNRTTEHVISKSVLDETDAQNRLKDNNLA